MVLDEMCEFTPTGWISNFLSNKMKRHPINMNFKNYQMGRLLTKNLGF